MKFINSIALMAIILLACNQKKTAVQKEQTTVAKPVVEKKRPNALTYSFTSGKTWKAAHKNDSTDVAQIVFAINRTDKANIGKDSILIPSDSTAAVQYYLPFPDEAPYLKDVKKIILFSYPAQAFGAYENGLLVYAGQTNMGRKIDPTPTGLYFTNWKAEKTTSTFNDEWDLKWNFNIENKEGIGFHEYALPGYPASHSCLRLIEADAKYLYNWADQWILKSANDITANGTPVIVFGTYDFDSPKPWLQLAKDPHALDISAAMVEKEAAPFLEKILAEQKKRDDAVAAGAK